MVSATNPLSYLLQGNLLRKLPALFLLLWLLPASAAAQDKSEIFVQLGHPSEIEAVAVSPDGRMLASGSGYDNTLKLWDAASGRELRTLTIKQPPPGLSTSIWSIVFSPDGHAVMAGTWEGVKLWDIASGRELRTFTGLKYSANYVAFSPDGRTAVASAYDGVKLWDVASGREVRTFNATRARAVVSPDGRTVASGNEDNTLKLWDVASGRELRTLKGHNAAIKTVAFSPDGRTLASGSEDNTLKLWDVASGRELRTLRHTNQVYAIAFSSDGNTMVSRSRRDKTFKFWDVASGRLMRTFAVKEEVRAFENPFALFPDGRTLVSAEYTSLRVLDVGSGKELRVFKGHASGLYPPIAFSPDGHTVLAVNKIWDVESGRMMKKERWPRAFSPDGRIAFSQDYEGTPTPVKVVSRIWDVASGRVLRTFEKFPNYHGIALSPDARTMVLGAPVGDVLKLWDAVSRRELRTLKGYGHAAFSPDGSTVAAGSLDKSIKLWDVASGRELRTLVGHAESVGAIVFSPDGRTLASVSTDSTLKLWDIASGRELRTLAGHAGIGQAVVFSSDGRLVVSGSKDRTLKIWDVATGRELRTLSGHTNWVTAATFSPDARMVASASEDRTLRIWDIATGKERASFISFENDEWVAITPEGYYDASEKGDQFVNVRVGDKVFGVDQYREKFYRPGLVKLALAGQALTGLASIQSVKPAPSVAIVDTPSSVGGDETTVRVSVADRGGGVGDVRLYLNGSAVSLDRRNLAVAAIQGRVQVFSYRLRLVSGKNVVRAIAFNAENSMQSADATHEIEAKIAAKKPSLHALVIGIQEYENPKLTLKYPIADAKLVANTLKERAKGLFESVQVTELLTRADTTRETISKAMEAMQKRVRPEDLFVFFVASHGTVDEGEYFLITSNVGATSTHILRKTALRQDDLKALIANVPATKKLVVIDTCNAGKLGEAIQVAMLTRGMSEDTAFKILSRAVGSTVLSASTSQQEALEGYQGHGLFTWVLTQGLQGKADLDKDGYVKTHELVGYVDDNVPLLAEKVFRHKQYPTTTLSGQGFPVVQAR